MELRGKAIVSSVYLKIREAKLLQAASFLKSPQVSIAVYPACPATR